MSVQSERRAREFLAIADQFQLGGLLTEASHPITVSLSDVVRHDTGSGLALLFRADRDVLDRYREWVSEGRSDGISARMAACLRRGGRLFFTGCGSTGRLSIQLDSIWRGYWQSRLDHPLSSQMVERTCSVMAGGDFALIKSVEGFEDFAEFGRRQILDRGVCADDMVFAITEGGETSFVIGTAWQALERGADTLFVYNNPDDVLVGTVRRSEEVILDPRIEKVNLTTGPMSISGSTRMQATSIQLCVMLTLMEMALVALTGDADPAGVPSRFLEGLEAIMSSLASDRCLGDLSALVDLEAETYRTGHRNSYFAGCLGIDVLTDTTERSPTYCTPPFRRYDDASAAESWAYLFVPGADVDEAWRSVLHRDPICVGWPREEVAGMVPPERLERQVELMGRIGRADLNRFRIDEAGTGYRRLGPGDLVVAVATEGDVGRFVDHDGFLGRQLLSHRDAGANAGFVLFARDVPLDGLAGEAERLTGPGGVVVAVEVPDTGLELDGVTRVAAKMLLNALSTCTMVKLGRVMGNTMIWVVASNLKLIDRASRYVSRLAGLPYEEAVHLLFEVLEYVEPRMRADQAYPPVVGLSVIRARDGLANEEAEVKLLEELAK